jgi:hypothetical protein
MNIKYKKMKGGRASSMFYLLIIIICGFLIGYSILNIQHKKRIIEIDKQQEIFKQTYIKENPLMIPLINAYIECENKTVKVVEGCIKHISTNDTDRAKLQNYLSSLGKIYMKGLK